MLLYRLFIYLYPLTARLMSIFSPKARRWCRGQQTAFSQIPKQPHNKKIIWMHCASMGEFEQGLPVLKQLKNQYPQFSILVSFFSPSGYEACKNHSIADWVVYLPMDHPRKSAQWISEIHPELVIFVKYEFWYYYLAALHQQKIPVILISAIFRQHQLFFHWYGGFYRSMLQFFKHILVQNEDSAALLKSIGILDGVTITGDTRFDRVLEIARNPTHYPAIEQFIQKEPVLVAGSTWPEDDKELQHFVNHHPNIQMIIVPHHIDQDAIRQCKEIFPGAVCYSDFERDWQDSNQYKGINKLIINRMGMLSSLYKYATVAYVGGGFGAEGVHNVLEATIFGKPVVIGPEYSKYLEVTQLVEQGGVIAIRTTQELNNTLQNLFENKEICSSTGKKANEFTITQTGATQKVMQVIQENRLLIN